MMMRLFAAIGAASAFVGASSLAIAAHRDASVIHVAIYRGPASCEDCSEAIQRAVTKLGPQYRAEFVGPGERRDVTPATLHRYQIYVQPGGGQDIDAALTSLGRARTNAIRGFVAGGGRYLGICMGAYLAGASNLGLVAQDMDSEVRRPGFPVTTIADSAVPIRWSGRYRTLYYQDGPYLPAQPANRAYRTIATYQNGDIAAARYSYGSGVVVLSGPHPEADADWFDDADLSPADMPGGTPIKALLDGALLPTS